VVCNGEYYVYSSQTNRFGQYFKSLTIMHSPLFLTWYTNTYSYPDTSFPWTEDFREVLFVKVKGYKGHHNLFTACFVFLFRSIKQKFLFRLVLTLSSTTKHNTSFERNITSTCSLLTALIRIISFTKRFHFNMYHSCNYSLPHSASHHCCHWVPAAVSHVCT